MLSKSSRLVVFAGDPIYALRFRRELMSAFVSAGYEVYLVTDGMSSEHKSIFKQDGTTVLDAPVTRAAISPISDLSYYRRLCEILRDTQPDIVLSYTVKAVAFGSIAAHRHKIRSINAMVPGLGLAFSKPKNFKGRLVASAVKSLYWLAFRFNRVVIFQNSDDVETVTELGLIDKEKCRLVDGSGVNLDEFPEQPIISKSRFLIATRLLKSKGVGYYIKAAAKLKHKYPNAEFCIAGAFDHSLDAIEPDLVNQAHANGTVNYLGNVETMQDAFADCAAFVIPSFYREGIPRSGLEALSSGRAIIASDAPGCRETVCDGKNGYLVEPQCADSLSRAMEKFLVHPDLVVKMGKVSRRYAQERFAVEKVNAQMLSHLCICPENGQK